jgi:uncharacterized protein YabN with tetrapyrrole methylase and pyrophosphatase domain
MKTPGYVHVVGIGPGDLAGISVGALRAIENAQEIWCSDLGPPNRERLFLRPYLKGKKIVNLAHYYDQIELPRTHIYRTIASRLTHLAQQGRKITFLFSGNPMVWVNITDMLKADAALGLLDLRITPSMSFLDLIWTSLPFGLRGALQVRATFITAPDVSTQIDCVVGQVGDTGATGGLNDFNQFVDAVNRLYPANHAIYVTGSDPIYSEISTVQTTPSALAATLQNFTAGFYVVVLPRVESLQ